MANNEIVFPISIVDRFGQPIARFSSGIDGTTRKVRQFDNTLSKLNRKPFDAQSRSLAQLRDNVERYRNSAENSFRLDHIRKYNGLISETERKIKNIEGATRTCEEKSDGFFGKLKDNFGISKGLLGIGAAMQVVSKSMAIGAESIDASSQIERYEVALKNMLGTSSKARDRMQEYFSIAKQTPFDLPQVIEVGNSLQALGKYSRENVVLLGDLASASGKPMEQAMRAYAKLATGQKGIAVDMFRDLMITTQDWTKATSKGVSKSGELLASTEELIASLPSIMKSKGYFGMMATQATTTDGKVSNLNDSLFQLKVALGERLKPAYDEYLRATSKAVSYMQQFVEIPIEEKIAREKAELNALIESLITNNTNQDIRKSLIEEIQKKYPDFLKNIDLEKASTKALREELEKTNTSYDEKMKKAAFQRQIEVIDTEMGESMDDVLKYQLSISAKKELQKYRNEAVAKFGTHASYLSSIAEDGQYSTKEYKNGAVVSEKTNRFSLEQQQLAITLQANIDGQKSLTTSFFVNDEKRRKKAEREYNIYRKKREAIQSLISSEYSEESGGGNSSGEGKNRSEDSNNKRSEDLSKSTDTITGGGKSIKNFNITIGNLIGENNQTFSSSDDNPASATDFTKRFSDLLITLVNDMNYAG